MAAKNDEGESRSGEIAIYGPIVESAWWDDEVSPRGFLDELRALGDIDDLHVHINSCGGHVSAGSAIYSILKRHSAAVTVHVDGFALSAASVIAMAGDRVIMPGNAMMMIHNPWSGIYGVAEDFRHEADVLDKLRDSMVAAYREKTGMSRCELIGLMDAETWMTAEESVEMGFADVAAPPLMAAACPVGGARGLVDMNGQLFDLRQYRNLPGTLLSKSEREVELMDEGKNAPVKVTGQEGTTNIDSAALIAQGREQGVTAERERQKALDELSVPGAEEVIRRAKYETGDAPEAAAMAIVKAQKEVGRAAFADRRQDAEDSGVNGVPAAVTEDGIGAGGESGREAKILNTMIKDRRNLA